MNLDPNIAIPIALLVLGLSSGIYGFVDWEGEGSYIGKIADSGDIGGSEIRLIGAVLICFFGGLIGVLRYIDYI